MEACFDSVFHGVEKSAVGPALQGGIAKGALRCRAGWLPSPLRFHRERSIAKVNATNQRGFEGVVAFRVAEWTMRGSEKRVQGGPMGAGRWAERGGKTKKVRRGGQGGFSDLVDAPTFLPGLGGRVPPGTFPGGGRGQTVGFTSTWSPRRAGLRWTSLGGTRRTPKRAGHGSPNSRTKRARGVSSPRDLRT